LTTARSKDLTLDSHFHAWYAGSDISVRIPDGSVCGQMQRRAPLRSSWSGGIFIARNFLEDWNLAQAGASLKKIEPLD
jgi:hypothetical protein